MPNDGRASDATSDDREAIVARVLEVAKRRLASLRGLQRADREDALQQTVSKVIEALDAGVVTQADAFTRRVAYHCGIDILRARQRAARMSPKGSDGHDGETALSVESLTGPDSDAAPSPESLVEEKARRSAVANSATDLWSLVEQAPENYRRVLERRYRDGHSLEDIAGEELARRAGPGAESPRDPKEFQRALATVHAWHSRALKWLQQRASGSWREVL